MSSSSEGTYGDAAKKGKYKVLSGKKEGTYNIAHKLPLEGTCIASVGDLAQLVETEV
jgi:hypothetical protein